jgi:hypothetical protein
MKALATSVFGWFMVLALVRLAAAATADDVKPDGQWRFVVAMPDGGELNLKVTLKQADGKLGGTLVGDDSVETEITDAELKNGELTFKISRDLGGQQLNSTFTGKLTAGEFDGSVDYDLGGQTGTLAVKGQRAANAVLGTWKLAIVTPDGNKLEPVATFRQEGDGICGTLVGDDGNEVKLEETSFKDDELLFTLKTDFGGQGLVAKWLVAKFRGKLDGGSLAGTVDYDLSGQAGTLDFTGTRQKLDLNGTWLLVATSDAGTYEPKMHLKHDGEDLSGKYVWTEDVVAEIKDGKVVDEEVTFTVTHDVDGQEIVVKYKLKPDGDKLTGTADYDLGGQTGTAQITGTRGQAVNVAGTWNITIAGENGQSYETTAKLTQEGGVISGDYSGPAGDAKISDAKLEGQKLTFKVVRQREGRKLVLTYAGEIDGDTMTGDVEFDFDGQTRTTKFEAKRTN